MEHNTEVTPARTLLDLDAEPVGGWWPDDIESVIQASGGVDFVEGPLHPRVGTVVVDDDLQRMPVGTVAEKHRLLMVRDVDYLWCACDSGLVPVYDDSIIGATILYVPLGEP